MAAIGLAMMIYKDFHTTLYPVGQRATGTTSLAKKGREHAFPGKALLSHRLSLSIYGQVYPKWDRQGIDTGSYRKEAGLEAAGSSTHFTMMVSVESPSGSVEAKPPCLGDSGPL